MDRLPFAVVLTLSSVVVTWRLWQLWTRRAHATTRGERIRVRMAPAIGACCVVTTVLGLLVGVVAVTGAAGVVPVIGMTVALLGVVVLGTLIGLAVVAAQEFSPHRAAERARAASEPPPVELGLTPGEPPTPQVAALLVAARTGDVGAICAALASEPLLVSVTTADVERALADETLPLPPRGWTLPDGRFEVTVHTSPCAPEPADGMAHRSQELPDLARSLTAPTLLLVDPGRPHQVRLEVAGVTAWLGHPGRRDRPAPSRAHRLLAHVPVRHDDIVHGLACAASQAVSTGRPWNVLGPARRDLFDRRLGLRIHWGIHAARDWQQTLDALADPQPSGGDIVFSLRRRIGEGAFVPGDAVARVVEDAVELNGRECTDAVLADLRRIEAYEGLLRDHHVLAEWEQVHSLLAWDQSRGARLARDGLEAGFCDHDTARWQLQRFGDLARRCYDSWPEFGAAIVLGRLLWSASVYDEWSDRASGLEIEDSIRPFTILLSDPTSPWRTVPFLPPAPAPAPAPGDTRTDAG